VRAVILAGGKGTRLRPYTSILPKPLVPVGDRPVLELILRRLAAAGARRVDLCIGHLGELIQVYFSQNSNLPDDLDLRWHREVEPLGTAGALRTVPDLDSTFVVMNGDVLTTVDFQALLEFHREQEALLTIAMCSQRVDLQLGVIQASNGWVVGYDEKPSLNFDVSMGIYVYEPRALSYLPEGACQLPELVLRLIEAGERVAACRSDALAYDIGTLEEHAAASRHLEAEPEMFGL
jgi:NDP-mannose synthase